MSCMLKHFRSCVLAGVEQLCLLAKLWLTDSQLRLRDVQNRFFFILVRFRFDLKKKFDSVRNGFGLVPLENAVWFGYRS